MEIGVWVNTSNPVLAQQFRRAMNFWAELLDMTWYDRNTRECSIQVAYGSQFLFDSDAIAARSQFLDKLHFHGWIAFNPKCKLNEIETYLVAVHEIGHLLGLQHNSNPDSIMYFLDPPDPPLLDEADLASLAKRHALRKPSAPLTAAHRVAAEPPNGQN